MAKVSFDFESCKGCGLCVEACPKKIIFLAKDLINSKGYARAMVADENMDKCIGCASCARMCPDVVITVER